MLVYYRLRGTIDINIISLLKGNMEDSKVVVNVVKFQVAAGRADPKGVVAPILSQIQVNANVFCEEFNERTVVLIFLAKNL